MNLTVLTENENSENKNLLCEHGLCFYIEDEDAKILFDTGFSDIFIKNASALGINLLDLDYIVLSHGHFDHTWGLTHYLAHYFSAKRQGKPAKRPTVVTHPDTFSEKYEEGLGEIGCLFTKDKLSKTFDVITTKKPYKLTQKLTFLGEIPRLNDFEAQKPMKKVLINGQYVDDYLTEDSALLYDSDKEISVITGCSHSGICNIIEQAKNIAKKTRVKYVVGGLHLIDTPKTKMKKITSYLSKQNIEAIYPCHCTSSNDKKELAKIVNIFSIQVGSKIDL